jgi:biotin transport system permease protein
MTSIGLYSPGSSVLHRLPVGWKLIGLLVIAAGTVALHQPWQLALAALVLAGLFAVGRIPARLVWQQLRPLRWLLAFTIVFQVVVAGWRPAVMLGGGLVLAVAAAALVTLTTTVTAILDCCGRLLLPLRRVGVDPDRVALVLAMTIRCIPLLAGIVDEVAQARRARGLSFSLLALAAPAVVRALRTADAMGDALVARGVDD